MDSFVLHWQLLQCSCLREPVPLFKPLPPTPIHGVGIKTLLTHLPSTVTDPKGPRRAGRWGFLLVGELLRQGWVWEGLSCCAPWDMGALHQGRKPWARPGWKAVSLSPKRFPLLPLPPLQTLTMNLLSRFIRSYACSSAYMGLCPLCAEPFRGVSDLQWPCEPLISEIAEAELQRRAWVS